MRQRLDARTIHSQAQGRWRAILTRLNIHVPARPMQHGPCPACGGKDRFRFDDLEGRGTWYCNQCEPHAGDGLALIQNVKQCSFSEVLAVVAETLGMRPCTSEGPRLERGPRW